MALDPSSKEGKTEGLPETRRVPDPTRRPRKQLWKEGRGLEGWRLDQGMNTGESLCVQVGWDL